MASFLNLNGLSTYHNKLKIMFTKKVDKETGKGLSTNDYTTVEKTKLGAIANGSQVNVVEVIKVDNVALPIATKSVNIDLSSFAKKADITSVLHYKGQKDTFSLLPSSGNVVGDMFNVKSTGANYVWSGTEWDKLSENIDLSVFYTKDEANATFATKGEIGESIVAITNAEIDALLVD